MQAGGMQFEAELGELFPGLLALAHALDRAVDGGGVRDRAALDRRQPDAQA